MSETALTLSGISKSYRRGDSIEISVLKGLDLRVRRAELVALVAPSGAGKSTLLHIAGLLDVPDGGQVEIAGSDVTARSDAERTIVRRDQVGFVYQFHHLLPEFSACENIALPQLAAGKSRDQANERASYLLERVGLKDRAGHRPAELSGGEQQRVAICRALANEPSVLLADEPTGNLDPATSDQVFGVLMDLVRETGMAAVIATHNLALAQRMDRVLQLDDGRLKNAPNE